MSTPSWVDTIAVLRKKKYIACTKNLIQGKCLFNQQGYDFRIQKIKLHQSVKFQSLDAFIVAEIIKD